MSTPSYDSTHADTFSNAGANELTSASWSPSGSDLFMVGFTASGASSPEQALTMKWRGNAGDDFTPQHAGLSYSAARFRPWTLIAPSAESNTSFYDWTNAQDETAGGTISIVGVDQATPIGVVASNTGNGATSLTASVDVLTADDDLVVYGVFFLDQGGASRTFSASSGTLRYTVEGSSLGFEGLCIATQAATAGGTTTCTATISGANPGDVDWGIFGFAVKGSGPPNLTAVVDTPLGKRSWRPRPFGPGRAR